MSKYVSIFACPGDVSPMLFVALIFALCTVKATEYLPSLSTVENTIFNNEVSTINLYLGKLEPYKDDPKHAKCYEKLLSWKKKRVLTKSLDINLNDYKNGKLTRQEVETTYSMLEESLREGYLFNKDNRDLRNLRNMFFVDLDLESNLTNALTVFSKKMIFCL